MWVVLVVSLGQFSKCGGVPQIYRAFGHGSLKFTLGCHDNLVWLFFSLTKSPSFSDRIYLTVNPISAYFLACELYFGSATSFI